MTSSKIKSIKKINQSFTRYNLEVQDNHNYFANNILVHNCRCLAKIENGQAILLSRKGKEFKSLPHINSAVTKILSDNQDIILDGELYLHGEEFQNLTSSIKRDSPSKNSGKVQYHVYDMISDEDFIMRWNKLWSLIPQKEKPSKRVVDLVWTQTIHKIEDLDKIHKEQIKRGFEGVMLRNLLGGYTIDKRSKDLQKVKKFMEKEFPIVGIEDCKGKMQGMCAFVLQTKSGKTFKCMPAGEEDYRRGLRRAYIKGAIKDGDLMTVRFFSWTTSDKPVPRFPVGYLRNYE